MALIEELEKLGQPENAGSMNELFANNEENVLFGRVSNSLREAVLGIKADMARELQDIVSKSVQEAISKVKVRDGRDGRDGKDGRDGQDGVPGKDAEKVELTAENIKGLPELIRKFSLKGGRGGGGSTLRVDNFSASANGSTTAFTATYRIGAAHALFYSGFPSVILPTTDYTVANRTVTLVAGVPIPQTGQSLLFIYEEG